jgi:hypothetical protein
VKVLEVRDDPKTVPMMMFSLGVERVDTLKELKSLLCPSSEVGVGKNYKECAYGV